MKEITILNQIDSNQFTFFDNASDTILREFEGFEYANVRNSIEDVGGNKSAVHVNSLFGVRNFAFTGDLVGASIMTLRRSLLNCLGIGSLKLVKFTTYDDLELQCEAELTKINNPYTQQIHTFNLKFVAPDFRFYTQELFTFTAAPTTVQGGVNIPADIPFNFTMGGGVSNIVQNNGNEETDPFITIHGPGTSFRVINQDTGEEFTVTQTLTSSEYLTIDVKKQEVIFAGNKIMNSFSGDFFKIIPGSNTIGFIVVGNGANTLLTINWRDAYNSL